MTKVNDLAVLAETSTLPSFIEANSNKGNQNVGVESLAIPIVKLLQDVSPEVKNRVAGAETGLWHHSVTGESVPTLNVVNLYHEVEWAIFKKRKFGTGLLGKGATEAEAEEILANSEETPSQWDIIETHVQTIAIIKEDNGALKIDSVAKMYFKSTSLQTARKWNTALNTKNRGAARFASIWELSSETSSKGTDTWASPVVSFKGFVPTEELYKELDAVYEQVVG